MDFDREQAETLVLSAIGMARWTQRPRLQGLVHPWSWCLIFNTLTLVWNKMQNLCGSHPVSESKADLRRKRADTVAERWVSAVTESLEHLSLGAEAEKEER